MHQGRRFQERQARRLLKAAHNDGYVPAAPETPAPAETPAARMERRLLAVLVVAGAGYLLWMAWLLATLPKL